MLLGSAQYVPPSGNVTLSAKVSSHEPSPSLSSSSDQRSIGNGTSLLSAPPLPPKAIVGGQGRDEQTIDTIAMPIFSPTLTKKGDNVDEESDWEKEISEKGDVFYVVPYLSSEKELSNNSGPIDSSNSSQLVTITGSKDPTYKSANKTGKKLSRLVRRRESKRDRSGSGATGRVPTLPEKPKVSGLSEWDGDATTQSKRKTISLLPAGNKSLLSTNSMQHNNR